MEINITVRDKIASGDGTWIVCGNSDYKYIAVENPADIFARVRG